MKKIICLIGLILVALGIYSQDKSIKMEILRTEISKDSITLYIEVYNLSNKELTVYTPRLKDICSSLMHIKFISITDNKTHEVIPCNYNANLKYVEVDSKNSKAIEPNCKISTKYTFSKNDISPFLKKGEAYNVVIQWTLNGQYVKTSLKNVFNRDLESNRILLKSN